MKAIYIIGLVLGLAPCPLQAQDVDKLMHEHGLVDIRSLDKRIRVELKYSTKDNFIG